MLDLTFPKPVLAAALAAAMAFAGCINAPDAEDDNAEPLLPPSGGGGGDNGNGNGNNGGSTGGGPAPGAGTGNGGATGNNTTQFRPPVARMQVFNATGALAFESDFVASDTTAQLPVEGGLPIRFVGSNSESVEPTAAIEAWAWDFGDGTLESGRSVEHTFRDTGGVFTVALRVTDGHGNSDTVRIVLGVTATRTFDANSTLEGSLVLGVPDDVVGGADPVGGVRVAQHTFDVVAEVEGVPVVFNQGTVVLTPSDTLPVGSEFDILLLNADGQVVARSPDPIINVVGIVGLPRIDPGAEKTITLGHDVLQAGTYTVEVRYQFGALGAYDIAVNLEYLMINSQVEGLLGTHSHS